MPDHPFALLLRRRLDDLDLKVVDAAAMIGNCRGSVFGWLGGDYQPAPNRYADIARVLQVPLSEVVLAAAGIGPDSPGA